MWNPCSSGLRAEIANRTWKDRSVGHPQGQPWGSCLKQPEGAPPQGGLRCHKAAKMVRCAWVEAQGSVSFSSTWMHFPSVRPWLFCSYDPLTQTQLREGRHHGLLVAKGLLGAAPAHSCESEAPAARHVDSGLLPSRSLAAPPPPPCCPQWNLGGSETISPRCSPHGQKEVLGVLR